MLAITDSSDDASTDSKLVGMLVDDEFIKFCEETASSNEVRRVADTLQAVEAALKFGQKRVKVLNSTAAKLRAAHKTVTATGVRVGTKYPVQRDGSPDSSASPSPRQKVNPSVPSTWSKPDESEIPPCTSQQMLGNGQPFGYTHLNKNEKKQNKTDDGYCFRAAARQGCLHCVRHALAINGELLNSTSWGGKFTALSWAIWENQHNMVSYLVSQGAITVNKNELVV